jgi:peptide/nickel transport system substrate-binding protein
MTSSNERPTHARHTAADPRISRRSVLGASALAVGALAFDHRGRAIVAQDGETPVRGGTARIAGSGAITSMDPFTSTNADTDRMIYAHLYDQIISLQPDGSFLPSLATEWTISDDGITYTFTLREGVVFHDGTALDAAAVKFNFDRYRAEGSTYPVVHLLRPIDSIEAPDATTVVFTLSAPDAALLSALSLGPIASPTAVEEMGEDFALHGVGSGPYEFSEWTPGAKAVFTRFDGYWDVAPDGQPYPYYDVIEIDGVSDDSVRLLNLRSGEFEYDTSLNIRDVSTASTDPSIQVYSTSGGTGYCLAMNPNLAPFDNKTLRQAAQAAVDLQAIIDNISFGQGYLSPMGYVKDTWFFIGEPNPVYDPDLARELLTEAGYPDGIDVTFTIINRPVDNQIAQIVAANLTDVGIRTKIEVLERTTWVDLWSSRQGQIGTLVLGGSSVDPSWGSGIYDPTASSNFAGYDNPEIQTLVAEQGSVADPEARLEIWRQIADIRVDDAVYVQIGLIPGHGAAIADARDFTTHPNLGLDIGKAWTAE